MDVWQCPRKNVCCRLDKDLLMDVPGLPYLPPHSRISLRAIFKSDDDIIASTFLPYAVKPWTAQPHKTARLRHNNYMIAPRIPDHFQLVVDPITVISKPMFLQPAY